jgi:hypothetical protein
MARWVVDIIAFPLLLPKQVVSVELPRAGPLSSADTAARNCFVLAQVLGACFDARWRGPAKGACAPAVGFDLAQFAD